MTENTKIEWADSTFNPWIGCTKVSPACDHCYAEALMDRRMGRVRWGAGNPRRRTSAANWHKPLAWERDHERFFDEHGHLRRVFCASLADVFDTDVPDAWRMDLFKLIGKTPHLDWLLLTKRIGNVMPMCRRDGLMFDLIGERVWLGITVVNQAEADRDIPKLLNVPANVRFLSCEPLLGQIVLPWQVGGIGPQCTSCSGTGHYHDNFNTPCSTCDETGRNRRAIHWVIAGGESGPHARPAHPGWFRSLRDQCAKAGVPFLFKQWGEWMPSASADWCRDPDGRGGGGYRFAGKEGVAMFNDGRILVRDPPRSRWHGYPNVVIDSDGLDEWRQAADPESYGYQWFYKAGKARAGRLLDGRTHDEFPIAPNNQAHLRERSAAK